MKKEIWKRPERGGQVAVCAASGSIWKSGRIDLINCGNATRKSGSSICTDAVRIRILEKSMDGEGSWII